MFLLIRKEVIDMADSKVEYPSPDCLAPAAIEAKTEAAGVTKANLPVAKAFLLAMFAGAFIAFGGLFFTVFLSDSTLGWGAQRVVGGLCFCLGLVLVLVAGAELLRKDGVKVRIVSAPSEGLFRSQSREYQEILNLASFLCLHESQFLHHR